MPGLSLETHSFMGHWDVARRYHPGNHCWTIWDIQVHCPVPVDTSSRHAIGERSAAFQTATCGVAGARCLHQELLSECLCHISKHCQVMCNRCENCAQSFAVAQRSPLPTRREGLIPMVQQHHRQAYRKWWCRRRLRWRIQKYRSVLFTNECHLHIGRRKKNMRGARWASFTKVPLPHYLLDALGDWGNLSLGCEKATQMPAWQTSLHLCVADVSHA